MSVMCSVLLCQSELECRCTIHTVHWLVMSSYICLHLFLCLSAYLSLPVFQSPSVCRRLYIFVSVSSCLSSLTCLSFCLCLCLCVCLSGGLQMLANLARKYLYDATPGLVPNQNVFLSIFKWCYAAWTVSSQKYIFLFTGWGIFIFSYLCFGGQMFNDNASFNITTQSIVTHGLKILLNFSSCFLEEL